MVNMTLCSDLLLHTIKGIEIIHVKEGKKDWKDKLPSAAPNLGPETGKPVH